MLWVKRALLWMQVRRASTIDAIRLMEKVVHLNTHKTWYYPLLFQSCVYHNFALSPLETKLTASNGKRASTFSRMSRNFGEKRNLILETSPFVMNVTTSAREAFGTIGVVIGCFDSDRYVIAPNRETQLARHLGTLSSRSCSHSSPWNWNSRNVFRNIGERANADRLLWYRETA